LSHTKVFGTALLEDHNLSAYCGENLTSETFSHSPAIIIVSSVLRQCDFCP